jgi:cob(I)alamin adenosyltransferase
MKIYTRTGDDGTTGLFGGGRRPKDDLRVDAYGTIDEANAAIGVARAAGLPPSVDAVLADVQSDLFTVGAELGCVPGEEPKLKMALIGPADAARLEKAIDAAEDGLPPLKSFVLSGGSAGAAALHLARCVVRRAERAVIAAGRVSAVRNEPVVYLNRLSDLLFTFARRANHEAGVPDVPWHPRKG